MSDPVTQYASDIVSGKEIAGPMVRAACARHLADLADGPARGLKWDWSRLGSDGEEERGTGKYVADFFATQLMLREDKPFILAPPLLFIVGSIFGWKGPDGNRRFRVAYVEMGKGNAKSSMAGGIGLYMLVADGEFRAECYTAACDKDQAKIPFRDAVAFVNLNPDLDQALKRSGSEGSEWNLAYLRTGSFLRPISSESKGRGKSGFRPHLVVLDEIHEHPTSAMVDLAEANLKTRTQPLVLKITNSGVVDPGHVCYQTHEHGVRMLAGLEPNDDAKFFYICGLDKGDDWADPKVRKKANPMLGVIPGMERYLDDAVAAAVGMPSKQSVVRRLNFCEWVESADPWIEKEVWEQNGGIVDPEELIGAECWGGLDLSKRTDLTTLVLVFPRGDGTKPVLTYAWAPEEGMAKREHADKAPYAHWRDAGVLMTTPGQTIDYAFIAETIGQLTIKYQLRGMAFDHWHFDEMERALNAAGVDLVAYDHPQGYAGMNPAIEATEQDILNRRLRHGGNPLLTWCVFNVKIDKNQAGLRAFVKQKATRRIDAAVSLAMACHMAAINTTSSIGLDYTCTVI